MASWKEAVVHALEQLNGHAYLEEIYAKVEELGERELIPSWRDTIRGVLERNSKDSQAYNRTENLFCSVEGIGKGHWGLTSFLPDAVADYTANDAGFPEGRKALKEHVVRERDPRVVYLAKMQFKNLHNGKLYCEACGFCFEDSYGAIGKDFIEGHHVKPVSSLAEGEKTRVADIIMLCSNCHSMIHKIKPWLTREALDRLLPTR